MMADGVAVLLHAAAAAAAVPFVSGTVLFST